MAACPSLLTFLDRIAPTFGGTRFAIPTPPLDDLERARLRTLHRNEEHLFRAHSAESGAPLISIYPPGAPFPIVSRAEWFSESWDGLAAGVPFDRSRLFFDQLAALNARIPRAATVTLNNENSEFTTGTGFCKNCYLINSSEYCEDCYYSKLLQTCRDVVDSSYCYDSELLYECFNVRNCYDCRWVFNSDQCSECWFCDDVKSCRNCLFCTNLSGQQYCIENERVSPQEFADYAAALRSDPETLEQALIKLDGLRAKRWYRYAEIVACEECTGDFLRNSHGCRNCYDVVDSEDCTNVQVGIKGRDLFDCSNMYIDPELSYQVLGTIGTFNVHFCLYVFHSSDLWYCEQCFSCKQCFGCVGLRNKEYCILNRQYSAAEYEATVRTIVEAMIAGGEWGEFFPAPCSPFPYNLTLAHEYFPLEEDEAVRRGFRWEAEGASGAPPAQRREGRLAKDVPDEICGETLTCALTGKAFRIQPGELVFYRKMGLPLPELAPRTRYQRRLALRNPRRLRRAACADCSAPVETTIAPELRRQILCDRHYLARRRG